MSLFLKAVSGTYLILVWLVAAAVMITHLIDVKVGTHGLANLITILIAISSSIPAAVMFGFAQIVGDVRVMRNNSMIQSSHLTAMRRYYEPQRQRLG